MVEKARDNLEYAEKFLQAKNVAREPKEMARGLSPGEDLVQFANDNDIDQIFVGIEKNVYPENVTWIHSPICGSEGAMPSHFGKINDC